MGRRCKSRGCDRGIRTPYKQNCWEHRVKTNKNNQQISSGLRSTKKMKHLDNKGGSNLSCLCPNWLKHYKNNKKGRMPSFCADTKCSTSPNTGAHVVKVGSSDRKWYIIPTCNGHNFGKKNIFASRDREIVHISKQSGCKNN